MNIFQNSLGKRHPSCKSTVLLTEGILDIDVLVLIGK